MAKAKTRFKALPKTAAGAGRHPAAGGMPVTSIAAEPQEDEDIEESQERQKLIRDQNRKNKKSGGFQAMGLSSSVYKGIIQKGYKIPTPIQRKTIPVLLDGKDVVAMARTGSGKTAAFLIPMFERLKVHSAKAGARAIIMSPTRELALQTLKFTKELGKNTGLRAAVILGGDRLDDQFEALHENPDIIIATPGRFMHVVLEMDLKLHAVEYVVFDEADRLFEMGFQQQLQEMLSRLPERRQTLLVSATLPKVLVEFAKAGLHEPTLIRLDADMKLSENLQLAFFHCRAEEKLAVLIHLLKNVLKAGTQSVVFVATKHHVEYLNALLAHAGIECACVYSAMDPTARKISVGKFQHGKVHVLLVTDLAARGIDIPMLDNVINYNFPDKGKLFVHRVGRVARAGRTGAAYSLVAPDEAAYMLDLHLFLGRPLQLAPPSCSSTSSSPDAVVSGIYGTVPPAVVTDAGEQIIAWHSHSVELQGLQKVCANGYKQYLKSRQSPSSESVKRAKDLLCRPLGVHPIFVNSQGQESAGVVANQFLDLMKNFRPKTTIFEINSNAKTPAFRIMQVKREKHGRVIQSNAEHLQRQQGDLSSYTGKVADAVAPQAAAEEESLAAAFPSIIMPSKRPADFPDTVPRKRKKMREARPVRDEENYLTYRPSDYQSEKGLGMGQSFEQQASGVVLNLAGDEDQVARKIDNQLKWDRKKKKFIREPSGAKRQGKIKTESGQWIAASYKSNAYQEWLQKTKRAPQQPFSGHAGDQAEQAGAAGSDDDDAVSKKKPQQSSQGNKRLVVLGHKFRRHTKGSETEASNVLRKELRNKEQILKERRVQAKKLFNAKNRGRPHKPSALQTSWGQGGRGGRQGHRGRQQGGRPQSGRPQGGRPHGGRGGGMRRGRKH